VLTSLRRSVPVRVNGVREERGDSLVRAVAADAAKALAEDKVGSHTALRASTLLDEKGVSARRAKQAEKSLKRRERKGKNALDNDFPRATTRIRSQSFR